MAKYKVEKEVDRIVRLVNTFSERDARLIENCRLYAANDPAGLPGHNLMLIVSKLCSYYNLAGSDILQAHAAMHIESGGAADAMNY